MLHDIFIFGILSGERGAGVGGRENRKSPLDKSDFLKPDSENPKYCITFILRGYLILAILAVKKKSRKYKSANTPILYAELNQGADKNGEFDEWLRYFL